MTNRDSFVSVVLPAYNAEKTIQRAIDSVLEQTSSALELILIDDHSTDRTEEMMQRYCERDSRVRILSNKSNLGVAQARNCGVESAHYDWIAFLDADDWWLPTKLEKQLAVMKRHCDSSICFTASAFVNEKGDRSRFWLQVPERITYRELLYQNLISCSSVLVRRETMLAHPMPDCRSIHEDYAVWLAILQHEPYAVGINEPLLVYQVSTGSKSGNKLKAAGMQWRTYRYLDIPVSTALPAWIRYSYRNLKKYRKIHST